MSYSGKVKEELACKGYTGKSEKDRLKGLCRIQEK